MIFLALYPGHLANLQWSWQVAVCLCLSGVVVAIFALTRPQLAGWHTVIALAGALLAVSSFATGIAMFPVALLLIALRIDQTWKRRVLAAMPWVAASVPIAMAYAHFVSPKMAHGVPTELLYMLDFTGAGIARLATDLAPVLGAVGIAVAAWAA